TFRKNRFDCPADGGKKPRDHAGCNGFIHELQEPRRPRIGWMKAMPKTRNVAYTASGQSLHFCFHCASDQTEIVRLRRLGIDLAGDGVIECDALLHSSAVNIA